jgi:hypothetical protein
MELEPARNFSKAGTGTITFSKVGTGTITFSKVGTGTITFQNSEPEPEL